MLVADALCRWTSTEGQCLSSYVLLFPLLPLWEENSEILVAIGLAMVVAGSAADPSSVQQRNHLTVQLQHWIVQKSPKDQVRTAHLSPALSQLLANLHPCEQPF